MTKIIQNCPKVLDIVTVVEKSSKVQKKPRRNFIIEFFLKLFSFCMPEAGYFPNKNFKIDHCGGLHHSLKSVSTALTTSSMRRKIRILLGNPVHAWRARVHTAAFSSYIVR